MNLNFHNTQINLLENPKVFSPNLTTVALLRSLETLIKNQINILELGCGSGIIGILLKKHFKSKIRISMIDKSKYAINLAKKNSKINKVKSNIVQSDLFSFLKNKNKRFDLIIDDVSAISNTMAKNSNWYNKFIPHSCGEDGSELTIQILKESSSKLNKKGSLIFPLISLSNHKKIINFARKNYKVCKLLKKVEWPLPKYFDDKILAHLKEKGLIYFQEKYGEKICFTKIYLVKN